MALIELHLEPEVLKRSLSWIFPVFTYVLEQLPDVTLSKKIGLLTKTTEALLNQFSHLRVVNNLSFSLTEPILSKLL